MIGYLRVNIDPYIIHFSGNFFLPGIKWYGVCYIACFFLLGYLFKKCARKGIFLLKLEDCDSFLWWFAMGAVISGRVGYCLLYQLEQTLNNPLVVFEVWNGGMSSHGGFVGAIVAILLFAKKFGYNALVLSDLVCATVPICLFLGRICNFINSELVGRVTTVPWAVIFIRSGDHLPRHPSQVYEAIGEGLVLWLILQWIIKNRNNISSYFHGMITTLFLILYSVIRIFCECFREPDAALIGQLTRGQFYSLLSFVLGIVLFFLAKKYKSCFLEKTN